jgi:DNA-binding MarR family transcriptional regulator
VTIEGIASLHRATHAVSLFIASLPGVDVSQAEAFVLALLHAAGPSRINDIHAAFGHRRSTLTGVLDRLEQRKLIGRSTDAADRRSVRVALTTAGKRSATRVYRALSQAEAQVLKGFTPAEVSAFRRVAEAFADLGNPDLV